LAGALRPVVVLMLVATALFVADGVADGVYPDGPAWLGSGAYHGLGISSYLFAAFNLLIAMLIAAGSERTLLARIGLSAFFIVERPLTAFVLGPKPVTSIGLHLLTALVELVILVSALRVWRLGHGVEGLELDSLLSLDAPSPAPPPEPDEAPAAAASGRSAVLLGLLTLLLAATLVADGLAAGFVPGGRPWGLVGEASGWLVYLFAMVLLVVAVRAVHGGALSLRILLVLALIVFIERAFTPLVFGLADPTVLALRAAAAIVAVALALACVAAIRGGHPGGARKVLTPTRAT
jgi:hypothetical protein